MTCQANFQEEKKKDKEKKTVITSSGGSCPFQLVLSIKTKRSPSQRLSVIIGMILVSAVEEYLGKQDKFITQTYVRQRSQRGQLMSLVAFRSQKILFQELYIGNSFK